MTNFTPVKVTEIWLAISAFVLASWNIVRGRKASFSGTDVYFAMLIVLKHGQQWDSTARLFGIRCCTFERLVTNYMKLISAHLYTNFAQCVEEKWTMSRCRTDSITIKNFEYARYATDVTFQQSNRPSGNISEGKVFFSGKQTLRLQS